MIYVWWLDGEKITRTVIISQAGVYTPVGCLIPLRRIGMDELRIYRAVRAIFFLSWVSPPSHLLPFFLFFFSFLSFARSHSISHFDSSAFHPAQSSATTAASLVIPHFPKSNFFSLFFNIGRSISICRKIVKGLLTVYGGEHIMQHL